MTINKVHSTVNWQISAIPAFEDNVIWLISNDTLAYVIDPGDAQPVIAWLNKYQRTLTGILLTHEHHDHIGGVAALIDHYPEANCFGHAQLAQSLPLNVVTVDETLTLAAGLQLHVISLAGHTPFHIGYYWSEQNALFCGDALFACGCGRLFNGGTPSQMTESLARIKQLPAQTAIYCAHEYTLANCRFAIMVEPDNAVLHNRLQQVTALRRQGKLTLPSYLSDELQTNPFLRTELASVRQAIERASGQLIDSPVMAFAQLRAWKDRIDITGILELPA
jgi:hydroxyacylglutathione hydrolase